MTRKDYLDGKVTHQQYYRTIAHEAGVSFRDSGLLPQIRKALDKGDEHLNSIPLKYWDWFAAGAKRSTAPVLEAHGDFWSLAGGVCIAKAAAVEAATEAEG